MYLKEIKISGFKSFADKINLNLDDNITCIVGPNGSGKSNIIDAVKWVLGEQSIKTLRGFNNMSDVIFAGSKSRSPLNLASVSLVFDNKDSYLKVPFTEIAITRKVYRSGENEYYINNEKCRLKDINDLFLDSGMGKYAFNIISQGEIEKVVNNSPYDRRVIFEEAAGVLKYKKRKEEALKKLEKTNDNLNRVTDILNEIETNLSPLEKQSAKAIKYKEIKENLKNIEVALIAHDLSKIDILYKDTTKKIDILKEEIVKLNTDNSSNDAVVLTKKEELDKLKEEIVKLNSDYLKYVKEEEKVNGERNIIKERSKYNADSLKVHENISSLKEEKYVLNNKLLSLKTDNDIIMKSLDSVNNDITVINEKLDSLKKKRKDVEDSIYSKQKILTSLLYKIKTLEGYILEGGNTNPSVKRLLGTKSISGIHNTIASLINASKTYDKALEVALGGSKDYVVVDTPEVAKKAISFLKEANLGRVTFYPLSVIKPKYIDEEIVKLLKREDGFIDILSNLVTYDDPYNNIVLNRLGNVLLVDNIDNANKLAKNTKNKFVIVTLDGEIIQVGGAITGGVIKQRSIISERHELDEITKEKDILTNDIKALEASLNDINNSFNTEREKAMELEKQKLLIMENIKNKNKLYYETKETYESKVLELSNLEDLTTNNISKEEDLITKKYYDILNKKDETFKLVTLKTSEKEKLEHEIDEVQASFRLSNSNIRSKEQELKELEISNTKRGLNMDNLLKTLSEDYEMTFESALQNYILDIDTEDARNMVNNYKKMLRDIGEVNLSSIEEYDRVKERYDFLTKQSEDLKEAIKTLLGIIDSLDEVMKQDFIKTFKQIEIEFDKVFKDLFGGGVASLVLTDKDNILETGIDIKVTPPGKKVSTITLLSGGEKTLTAISLLFAILNIKKVPFCLFDEIEAALDEANVARVCEYFSKYNGKTQLIIITHKKKTMEYANALYGITMQESGVSKLVSVKLV